MKNYIFTIIVEQDQDGYFVYCPDLQGCYSQGETYEEALENIKDAIKLHLLNRLEAHEEINPDIQDAQSVSLPTVQVPIY